MSEIFQSDSPEATSALAMNLARTLTQPAVIALHGDLGAGKTLFTQALAQALGIRQPVTSPTFTLINEYDLPDGGKLYHVDCYRLHDPVPEAMALGLEELFDAGIVVIEWADRILPMLPQQRIDISFEYIGDQQRRIIICGWKNIES